MRTIFCFVFSGYTVYLDEKYIGFEEKAKDLVSELKSCKELKEVSVVLDEEYSQIFIRCDNGRLLR